MRIIEKLTKDAELPVFGLLERISLSALVIVTVVFTLV